VTAGRTRGLAGVVAMALAACGADAGEEAPPPTTTAPASQDRHLTAGERRFLGESEARIVSYCQRVALGLTEPEKKPTVGQQARALEAVDGLVALAREKPSARVSPGVDVGLFLGDLAENLEGSNCDPAIIARIDQGLASLPP
jgi:hypothetical protein